MQSKVPKIIFTRLNFQNIETFFNRTENDKTCEIL